MLSLRCDTAREWAELVLANLDRFLQDHANNERKVSGSALSIAAHYPERSELARAMIALAREELEHYEAVHEVLLSRGMRLAQDEPDPYTQRLWKMLRRRNRDEFLLDRLLVFGIVEARGCERFRLVAEALKAEVGQAELAEFYADLAASEARHHTTYIRFAHQYFPGSECEARMGQLLDAEAELVRTLPLRPCLH